MRQREGAEGSSWILVDLYDCIVHIFTEQARQQYRLEQLWGDRPMEVYEGKRHGKGSKWLSKDKDSGSNCYGSFSQLPTIMRTERYPVSIIRVKRKHDISHHYHPTEKPVELLRWLIKTYTNPGDVVLDNTMGSGSTCFAALLEDRRFIGIEKEKQYYDIAVERLQSAVSDKELKND